MEFVDCLCLWSQLNNSDFAYGNKNSEFKKNANWQKRKFYNK